MKPASEHSLEDLDKSLPRQLGRYILLTRLHGGGMTEVYTARLAEEVGPGRLLVIKILPLDALRDVEAEARFLEEARIVLNLTHGNITAAFEFGREGARPFLVLEYVPGPSLRLLLTATRQKGELLPVEDVLFVVRQVCQALAYAHACAGVEISKTGIVHRDISPDNILISSGGQVKLTDFGIADLLSSQRRETIWGKANYIAPEVIAGERPSPAADIYSLGAVLYECLTGAPPLVGKTDAETLKLVQNQIPVAPSTKVPSIPHQLDGFVLRLLAKTPAARIDSASAAEIELRSLLNDIHFSYTESDLAITVQKYFPQSEDTNKHSMESPSGADGSSALLADTQSSAVNFLVEPTMPLSPRQEDTPQGRLILKRRLAIIAAIFIVGLGSAALLWQKGGSPIAEPRIAATDSPGKKAVQPEPAKTPVKKATPPPLKLIEQATQSTEQRSILPKQKNKPSPGKKKNRPFRSVVKDSRGTDGPAVDNSSVAKWGWLNINSYPWSHVSVDGKRLNGHTPYKRVQLTVGVHTLVFENPKLNLRLTRQVTVRAWEETNIGVKLDESP
ncbi:MAG: serine/threonine-protein kinase [Myxococcota bacterium]|nr:serine/threonine-protein kinase [Myxococcota bacterium]